jgi:hypothetical protein
MALKRLQRDEVYRLYLAHPLAFANWQTPTAAELNANPTNNPHGLIFNLTCALNTDGTQFDLDDPELDDSLTFCQTAGDSTVSSRSATIVYEFEESKTRWTPASSTSAANGFNTATLAKSLLAWRGVEYYAILSVGKSETAPFAVADRVKMAQVATDWAVPVLGTGENIRWSQTFAKRSNLNWNYKIAA